MGHAASVAGCLGRKVALTGTHTALALKAPDREGGVLCCAAQGPELSGHIHRFTLKLQSVSCRQATSWGIRGKNSEPGLLAPTPRPAPPAEGKPPRSWNLLGPQAPGEGGREEKMGRKCLPNPGLSHRDQLDDIIGT